MEVLLGTLTDLPWELVPCVFVLGEVGFGKKRMGFLIFFFSLGGGFAG